MALSNAPLTLSGYQLHTVSSVSRFNMTPPRHLEICAWSPLDSKLSCSGRNERVKAEIVSWTVNKDNMVNVRTAAMNSTEIHVKDVEILNIDQNRIGRAEFERLVARFPNLQGRAMSR